MLVGCPTFIKQLPAGKILLWLSLALGLSLVDAPAAASSQTTTGIHRAPIVIPGFKVRAATRYPISTYRLFRTDPATGKAVAVPFQIDEINEWGDYVLDQGSEITKHTGNGIFDLQDELVVMGDDVGPLHAPTSWPDQEPSIVYELRFRFMKNIRQGSPSFETAVAQNPTNDPSASPSPIPEVGSANTGAMYVGVFFRKPPAYSPKSYVNFSSARGEVTSSRYRYEFDKKNYLVVNGVDMVKRGAGVNSSEKIPLLNSSTFYMRADLKYFVTATANHRSVDSKIEAFKIGPVRSIVRVSFFYTLLKLKFELGMYTEVSFFSNSVVLPAILYNPLDGPKSLNRGSGFYYGFSVKEPLSAHQFQTNMPPYQPASMLGLLKANPKPESIYWMSMTKPDRMMYLEIMPSKEMLKANNLPYLYTENIDGDSIRSRSNDEPQELGKSPVNIALYFDLTRFSKGEHRLSIRLFFENYFSQSVLDSFRDLPYWETDVRRL
jgi:hypothetical protein